MIRTKIICTLGPACDNDDTMRSLLQNGMDCARMNFSHGSHAEHSERLSRFRRIRDELGMNTAVLLDTKGPEIRTGDFAQKTTLETGTHFIIKHEDTIGDTEKMSVSYKELQKDIAIGQSILIDDGLVGLRVEKIDISGDIHCIIENGGTVSSKKSVNVPGAKINLPPLTERDKSDLLFAIENDYDFIAVSFVRKASDVHAVRRLLDQNGGRDIRIIAKIENREGLENIDEIISASHGIMVARGDLGVEIPVHEVPVAQKAIIKKCLSSYKVVITATQMLDSMIRNPRPTRAEASDVANAIYDGTSCIMLSGETANGKYPLEALKTMVDIAQTTESSINYWRRLHRSDHTAGDSVTDAISFATCTTAHNLQAKAIVTVTHSGHTARSISRFHPACPIITATPNEKALRQLHLSWGVFPYLTEMVDSTDELVETAMEVASKTGFVSTGDLVVLTAGLPVGIAGTTNMIRVHMIGNILATGTGVCPGIATGEVAILEDLDSYTPELFEGCIIVAREATDSILPLMRKSLALIVEGADLDGHATSAGLALDIPVLINASGAMSTLKNGTVITVDGDAGLVRHG